MHCSPMPPPLECRPISRLHIQLRVQDAPPHFPAAPMSLLPQRGVPFFPRGGPRGGARSNPFPCQPIFMPLPQPRPLGWATSAVCKGRCSGVCHITFDSAVSVVKAVCGIGTRVIQVTVHLCNDRKKGVSRPGVSIVMGKLPDPYCHGKRTPLPSRARISMRQAGGLRPAGRGSGAKVPRKQAGAILAPGAGTRTSRKRDVTPNRQWPDRGEHTGLPRGAAARRNRSAAVPATRG